MRNRTFRVGLFLSGYFFCYFSVAQEEPAIYNNSLSHTCEQIQAADENGRSEIRAHFLEQIPKAELETLLYSALINKLSGEGIDSCSLDTLDLLVSSSFPPASKIAILNKSVQTILEATSDSRRSISQLSGLSNSLEYLLGLSNFPKEIVLKKLGAFLNDNIEDSTLDLRYRLYSYLILSSQSFLLNSDCPRFLAPESLVLNSVSENGDLLVPKVRSQCSGTAVDDSMGILRKVTDSGGQEPLREILKFFSDIYPAPEQQRFINMQLVRDSLSRADLRSVAFPLITREIISELTLGEKFQLLLLGEMPFFVYLILVAILSIPVIIYLVIFFALKIERVPKKSKTVRKEVEEAPKVKSNIKLDEYSSLLAGFGLDDTATDADIKKAYRDLAKSCHPDSADNQLLEEFDKIQTNYDQLMKLRKGWFGLTR